jgi:hypothetical protein
MSDGRKLHIRHTPTKINLLRAKFVVKLLACDAHETVTHAKIPVKQ